ncbi:NAD-dependent epimerase/dehydratase family protein [Thetidibacter halocola]|uniref:NAD(P)-dependent oxidoreductase n=1 Tax=Thetidibacter halocola TaxID=2827239 RepID=A0A8J7WDI0_9RHOB|nr:NAD(P)-dependent oxidoreductase [Thetidibacter halocola]MBS0123383.1 NAD(P)-dependent oxidoreductase [Thetidibacter halocola]
MGALTVAVTGASGFVGRACVAEARARGVRVTAILRGEAPEGWADDDGIRVIRADLARPEAVETLRAALDRATAVIHAAAHLGGDAAAVQADTLRATDHLLAAMQGGAARLVLISSIAVHDTMRLKPGALLDESAPLEDPANARDAYCRGKLLQEDAVRASGLPAWLLRPGALYGPGRTWHALSGFGSALFFITIGSAGELPLMHVTHAARAAVTAALTDPGGVRELILLDDDRPTRGRFVAAHRRATGLPRLSVTISYGLWRAMIQPLRPVSRHLPGLFREPILRARMMPLRYSNAALHDALGHSDDAPFEAMLARSIGGAP